MIPEAFCSALEVLSLYLRRNIFPSDFRLSFQSSLQLKKAGVQGMALGYPTDLFNGYPKTIPHRQTHKIC